MALDGCICLGKHNLIHVIIGWKICLLKIKQTNILARLRGCTSHELNLELRQTQIKSTWLNCSDAKLKHGASL